MNYPETSGQLIYTENPVIVDSLNILNSFD